MASEIVNRTMSTCRLRFTNHLVAEALHFADNSRDQLVETAFDGTRPGYRQIEGIRHEPEQLNFGRVTVDETRCVKKVHNPYLVSRQAVPHRIHHIGAI